MEKDIKIKTTDKHAIYGILNQVNNNKNLIIFVHGLTGHMNEHIHYNGAKYFANKGFNSFRFGLYSGEKNARELINCTIKTHSKDLNTVVTYFSKKYDNIHLIGHSLGGPSILGANMNNVSSIALWDPSFDIAQEFKTDCKFNKKLGAYIIKWGVDCLISKKMYAEVISLPENMAKKIVKPTKLIFAGKGILYKKWKNYLKNISVKNSVVKIEKASHCFDEEGAEELLFKETYSWFKKY